MSRTEGKPTPTGTALMAPTCAPANDNNSDDAACHHEHALKTLHTDIDAMRQLVTCKICDRLLYEPYALSCGHTYCYSCLSQWLGSNRKKTCPDCRSVITQQPTPSYIIRELVLIFVSRSELLPDGETSEEHNSLLKDEAETVTRDRANKDPRTGGLFKGCFARGRGHILLPLHDRSDMVDRCPECHWELEDGFCNQCGINVDGGSHAGFSDYGESDISDDDLDHELDMDDMDARDALFVDGQDDSLGGEWPIGEEDEGPTSELEGMTRDRRAREYSVLDEPQRIRRLPLTRRERAIEHALNNGIPFIPFSDEEESDDEERDSTMGDFVVDDTIEHESSDEEDDDDDDVIGVPENSQSRGVGRRRTLVVISDDEDGPAISGGARSESEQDSEDEGPVARGSQRNNHSRVAVRQRRAHTISSDEESSEDDTEDHGSDVRATSGFSPLDGSIAGEASSVHSDHDSEAPSSIRPTYEDDEDDGEEESESDEEDGWGPLSPMHLAANRH